MDENSRKKRQEQVFVVCDICHGLYSIFSWYVHMDDLNLNLNLILNLFPSIRLDPIACTSQELKRFRLLH